MRTQSPLVYGFRMTFGECLSRVRSRLLPLVALVALAAVLTGCKTTALIAPAGDYLYWGDGDTPSIVHKVRTSDLVEVGSLALPSPPAASPVLRPTVIRF